MADKGNTKSNAGKAEWHLLPWEELEAVVDAFMEGKYKYAEDDWKERVKADPNFYKDAIMRHATQYLRGWDDEDHLARVCTNALILMWWKRNK